VESWNFAKWDGARWHPLDIPFRGWLRSMAIVDGDLYVGGEISLATSSGFAKNIARWDGSKWDTLHGGTDEMVLSVFGLGSHVYVCGLFNRAGGVPVHHVARWDGNSWSSFGSGLGRSDTPEWWGWEFAVAANESGEVYVGGDHTLAGGIASRHIARWYNPVPAPSNGFPPHRSKDQPVDVRLSWGTSDRPSGGLTYDTYFGTTSPPPLLASDHPETSLDPDSLEFETTYYWKIIAKDGNGNQAHGPLWRFRTEDFTSSRLVVSSALTHCALGSSDTVTVNLNIEDSPFPIDAAGVDVTYDPGLLAFLSCEPGDLTAGWQQFDCADLGTSIRVGGFDLTAIPPGSYGVFARLTFLSNCCSQDSSETLPLCALNLTDDLASLRPVCGELQCQVSNAKGDGNGDGTVTVGDALCTFEGYLGLPDPLPLGCASEGWEARSDVDCSGAVTPGDALCIFLHWLSGACEFCGLSAAPASAPPVVPVVDVPEIRFDGDEVTVAVRVSDVPALEAFGFEVVYPKDQIEYVGLRWAAVSNEFEQIGGRQVEEGLLRLGGFATQPVDAVQADLVELRFRTLVATVAGSIVIHRFVDDLRDAAPVSAELKGDTPTLTRYALYQNQPNPFNPTTTIRYEIPNRVTNVHVTLTVHDVQGRVVRRLVNETKRGGPHEVRWDGRNEEGKSVSSGVYFSVLHAGGRRLAKKVVLLR
jgi:hypothetical protein